MAIASDGDKPEEGIESTTDSPGGDQTQGIREPATNSPAGERPDSGKAIPSDGENPTKSPAGEQPFEGIDSATNSPAGDGTNAATLPPRFVTGDRIRGVYHTAYGDLEEREGIVEVDPLGRHYVTLEKKAKFDMTPRVLLDSLQNVRALPDPVVTRETTELIGQLAQQGTGLEAIRELIAGRYGFLDRRLMSTSQLRDLRDRILSLLANATELDPNHQHGPEIAKLTPAAK